jgi:1,4-alpha-glucan branching enzyme
MGGEFAQTTEWAHEKSLDWHLLEYAPHQGMMKLMSTLNTLYKEEGALYEYNFEESGFEWIDINDSENSVVSWLRKGKAEKDQIVVVANFTPVPRENYRVGVPKKGFYAQIFNSDAGEFTGSSINNDAVIESVSITTHGRDNSIAVTLPPLAIVYYKYQKKGG